ncbi:MAG: cytochrome c [Gammaproteobacteria bacterium]
MRTTLLTLLVVLVFAVAGGLAFIYSGVYNISATRPHWPITEWAIETMRSNSIKAHASGITLPPGMTDEAAVISGTEHFAAHCASCHGAPGVPRGDIANGLYPKPPDLAHAARHYTPGELFWIVKNGIKMTGMPAWNDHSDKELWATVAFLQKLPGMSEADYAKLVRESMTHGSGQHHHGGKDAPNADSMPQDNHSGMPGMTAPETSGGHRH